MTKFSSERYIEGAAERIRAADIMYDQKSYVDTLHLSGVAVECVLRGFAFQPGVAFDGRHDLQLLLKAATPSLEKFVGSTQRANISTALVEVWTRWKNWYRYAGDGMVRAELKEKGLDRGIHGNFVKENARLVLENATIIVNKGVAVWASKKKKLQGP